LKVPEGTADVVRDRLAQGSATELAPLRWYTVRKGETIASIARKLKVSRADLAEANYLSAKARVNAGQQLIVPRAPTLLLAARTESPVPVTESRSLDPVLASNVVTPAPPRADQTKLVYRVKRGDTLFSIAKLYRTTIASLRNWNRIRGNAIQVGQRLTIFTTRALATN